MGTDLNSSWCEFIPVSCNHPLRARLHEPGLDANPGQPFSSQTLVQLQAFDWKRVDPGWRPDPGWLM